MLTTWRAVIAPIVVRRHQAADFYHAHLSRRCFKMWLTFVVTRRFSAMRKQVKRVKQPLSHNEKMVIEFAESRLTARGGGVFVCVYARPVRERIRARPGQYVCLSACALTLLLIVRLSRRLSRG